MGLTAVCLFFVSYSYISGLPSKRPLQKMPMQFADPLAVLQMMSSSHGLPKPAEERATNSDAVEVDMVLTSSQKLVRELNAHRLDPRFSWKRKAVVDETRHWPQAIIPFEFDANLDAFHLRWAMDAMMQWQLRTCIRFQRKNRALSTKLGHSDFIRFTAGTDCKTSVGRISGGQTVSIGSCNKGSIVHELGHSLGYVHEQSRPDRDDNVRIIIANVRHDRVKEFRKYSSSVVTTFGTPYDYGSIMHYSSTAFSKSDNPLLITVQTNDPHVQMVIGQRKAPSFLDVKLANELYKCNSHCSQIVTCHNDGYVGPNCTCICPDGLTGQACDQVIVSDSGCGAVLTSATGSVESPQFSKGYYPTGEDCYWLIQGPPNSTIDVTFDSFDVDNEGDCQWCSCDYLETKVYGFDRVGQRFCGSYVRPIRHNSSSLLLHFHADDTWSMNSGLKFSYQII